MYDTVLRASFLKDGDEREHGWHLKIKLSHVTGLIRWKMEGWWWGGGVAKTSLEVQILPQHERLLLKYRRRR